MRAGESLKVFVLEHVPALQPGDILAVTSKIVALAENRVIPPGFDKRKEIQSESEETRETPWCLLTRRGSDWCANAGVDESNANDSLILLPKDPKRSALSLHQDLSKAFGIDAFGILLTDTRIVPLRQGTMGMALAWSGLEPIHNYIGSPDLFGRELKMTKSNLVHALAAAAVLVMGEGAESVPIVIIRNSGVTMNTSAAGTVEDVAVLPEDDLYRFVYRCENPAEG